MVFLTRIDNIRLKQQIGVEFPIAEGYDRYRCGNDDDDQSDRDSQNSKVCAEDIPFGSIRMITHDPPTFPLLCPKQ